MDIRDQVFTAMQNAADNGHTFMGWTYEEITDDLISFDSSLEVCDPRDIIPHVEAFIWKPEVDKIEAFIKQGNLEDACDHVNKFLSDVQSHIYSQLPLNLALQLAEYDRTDESFLLTADSYKTE